MNLDDLARSYATTFKTLKAEWYYAEPRGQAAAEFIKEAAAARESLQQISAAVIVELLERRSFWINLYNGAVVDRAIALGVGRTVREIGGFFRERWFHLAGEELSLDDIEHGFLRANRRHPARLLPPLLFRPRLKGWSVHAFDPRIHFALNCGGHSCPPIGAYASNAIEAQLDLATSSFLDAEVEIDSESGTIRANRILRWYWFDFGRRRGVEEMLRRYRTGGLDKSSWKFAWKPYDWEL